MTKKEQRIKKLTEYLQRLGAGEELEEVRKDFIKEFSEDRKSTRQNSSHGVQSRMPSSA